MVFGPVLLARSATSAWSWAALETRYVERTMRPSSFSRQGRLRRFSVPDFDATPHLLPCDFNALDEGPPARAISKEPERGPVIPSPGYPQQLFRSHNPVRLQKCRVNGAPPGTLLELRSSQTSKLKRLSRTCRIPSCPFHTRAI